MKLTAILLAGFVPSVVKPASIAMKRRKYFYRALWKPDQLGLLKLDAGPGVEGRGLGYAQAWHRQQSDRSPYAVPNEYICGELGRFLRLPVPPFAITFMKDGRRDLPMFSSLDFNFSRDKLPPVIADICVQRLPQLCAGVLLFDIWIANEDRHDENLLVDNVGAPTEMVVFDHDQALFGGLLSHGAERLDKLIDRLGITGSAVTGGNRHVFLKYVTTNLHFDEWLNRIHSTPTWFIREVCQFARTAGLSRDEAVKAQDFLDYRRKNLDEIIRRHRAELFVTDWGGSGELDL